MNETKNSYDEQPAGGNSEKENDINSLLSRMEDTVAAARSMPFSDNCMVDREEMIFLLRMIRETLPDELQQAKWLLEQNRQLIAEARKEADSILSDASMEMARMIDEHEITQQAREQAAQAVDAANQSARQIRNGAMSYTQDMLTNLDNQLTEMLVTIRKNKQELK